MQEFITESNGSKRAATRRNCNHCNVSYLARNIDLDKGYGKYCCRECSSLSKSTKVDLECSFCKEIFKKTKSKIRKFNFCSRDCKDKAQRIDSGELFSSMRPSHYGDGRTGYRKRVMKDKDKLECERCGWNQVPRLLQVHHIDHDRTNGRAENLELLCLNCHSVEHCAE